MKVALKAPRHKRDKHQVESNDFLAQLRNMEPAEAAAWVDANVPGTMPEKMWRRLITKAVVYLLRERLDR